MRQTKEDLFMNPAAHENAREEIGGARMEMAVTRFFT